MTVYPIAPFDERDDGLDFAEFWDDPALVSATVTRFARKFSPAKCYCLRLNPIHDTRDSTFVPYSGTGLPSENVGLLKPIIFYRLLFPDETWPVLARLFPDPGSQHPQEIATGVWFGEARLRSGSSYVGFLKAVVLEGSTDDKDDKFKIAYSEVKDWLKGKVADLRRTAIWSTAVAKALLESTHDEIARALTASAKIEAIQRLAALITSHVGTGFNRIACLLPAGDGALECVYAHGGDCSESWAKIQDAVVQDVGSPAQLQNRVALQIPPVDDPLYDELVASHQLRIPSKSSCLISEIWESKGKLDSLSEANTVADELDADFPVPYILAGKFHLWDSWVAAYFPEETGSALHSSKNRNVYVLPWSSEGGALLGLWLLDLGQWSPVDERCDVVPRLKSAKGILEEFSADFRDYILF